MDDAILTDKSGKVKALPCVLFAFFQMYWRSHSRLTCCLSRIQTAGILIIFYSASMREIRPFLYFQTSPKPKISPAFAPAQEPPSAVGLCTPIYALSAAFGGCAPKRFAAARSAMSGQRLCLWKPQFFEKNCVKLLGAV